MKCEIINKSCIYYNEEPVFFIKEYYLYCVDLIKRELKGNQNVVLNIIVGKYFKRFKNHNNVFQIDIQTEHTLVVKGGRDSKNAPIGAVPTIYNHEDNYLVRIHNLKYLNRLDYIIDYSIPNIINIKSNIDFEEYYKKTIVVSPLLYDFNKERISGKRDNNIITTFINPSEKRRSVFLNLANNAGLLINNIVGLFSTDEVYKLYSTSKILVNIHQTDFHHTFEELRVLPALLCGCIVVSENVPLKESIPYHKFVVWADYDSIVDVVKEVELNYDNYFRKIFIESDFDAVLNKIQKRNCDNIHRMIFELNEQAKGRNQLVDVLFAFVSRVRRVIKGK